MAELDPRDPPNENRTVTIGYLNELYAKVDKLHRLEKAVRAITTASVEDLEAACQGVIDILEEP